MKVLVFGDIITDKYIYGTSSRISPEAPVPVVNITNSATSLGGAGLVFENLKSLGVDVTLFDTMQPRSTKTRIISDGHYITRLDEDEQADGEVVLKQVIDTDFSQYEYVILSDYNKGVLDNAKQIIEHINSQGCKVIVDPKRNAQFYQDAWLVKPNAKELIDFDFKGWKGNIITTDADRNVVATIDNIKYNVPVEKVEVSDVTGAGDCFLAGFVYGLTKEYSYKKCLQIAIKGSTKSVSRSGTYILKQEDLNQGIVWTNGVFDILHTGHLELLRYANTLGKKLIVGINSDPSVKRLKGNSRPINSAEVRKKNLETLPWVDEVIVFDDDTPLKIIETLQPNIIVKGGDYTVETVVGHEISNVVIFPTIKGHSTTEIIDKMKANHES